MSWNLYHGRDFPPDPALLTWRSRLLRTSERNATHVQVNHSLRHEFATQIANREWDVALLQEAPPRWLPELARAARASGVLALTSRNLMPAVQGRLADWNPDLLASWEGGSNQLLVRGRILAVRRLTLTRRPERRRLLWARVLVGEHALLGAGGPGERRELCVACLHASAGMSAAASAEVLVAAERAIAWAGSTPVVFGGDFNLRPARDPAPFAALANRFGLERPTGPNAIDHVLVRGLEIASPVRRSPAEERELLDADGLRIRLSDHGRVVGTFGVA
jgi:endonuclease/exonuclease/phosphatase family metal-dependent hydrolase